MRGVGGKIKAAGLPERDEDWAQPCYRGAEKESEGKCEYF
jgi:hypothetical protein